MSRSAYCANAVNWCHADKYLLAHNRHVSTTLVRSAAMIRVLDVMGGNVSVRHKAEDFGAVQQIRLGSYCRILPKLSTRHSIHP
jgi:hypothetical protein